MILKYGAKSTNAPCMYDISNFGKYVAIYNKKIEGFRDELTDN